MSLIQRMKDKWKKQRLRRSVGVDPNTTQSNMACEQSLSPRAMLPVINTQWGDVSESARLQAALNMKADPEKRLQVEELLGRKMGSTTLGMAEARRRYPEAYQEDNNVTT